MVCVRFQSGVVLCRLFLTHHHLIDTDFGYEIHFCRGLLCYIVRGYLTKASRFHPIITIVVVWVEMRPSPAVVTTFPTFFQMPPPTVVVATFPTFFQETDDPAFVALALTIPPDLNPTVVPGAVFPGLFSSSSLPSLLIFSL
jgi:hypothetical protein